MRLTLRHGDEYNDSDAGKQKDCKISVAVVVILCSLSHAHSYLIHYHWLFLLLLLLFSPKKKIERLIAIWKRVRSFVLRLQGVLKVQDIWSAQNNLCFSCIVFGCYSLGRLLLLANDKMFLRSVVNFYRCVLQLICWHRTLE